VVHLFLSAYWSGLDNLNQIPTFFPIKKRKKKWGRLIKANFLQESEKDRIGKILRGIILRLFPPAPNDKKQKLVIKISTRFDF
jgi:hypothetical protein